MRGYVSFISIIRNYVVDKMIVCPAAWAAAYSVGGPRKEFVMAAPKVDPKAVLEFAKHNNVQMLDLRFTDLPGLWHHVSYPIGQLTEESFEEGFGMDGSSIRGWGAIHESDMLLIPDPPHTVMAPPHPGQPAGARRAGG